LGKGHKAVTTDEEAFVRAILEDPDEDAVRLIFADWLEERGSPRAEFIRLQCALARLPEGQRRGELLEREQQLLRQYEAVWAAPLLGLVDEWEFRRGFVEKIRIIPVAFVARAEGIFRRAPVRHVHFYRRNHVSLAEVETLAGSPWLARLAALKLNSDRGLRTDGVRALTASSHLAGLRRLDLSENAIDDAGAAILAACPHLTRLTLLNLWANRISRRGRAVLLDRFGPEVCRF
jgi:uncharacterized protein (TIGR02996 family)